MPPITAPPRQASMLRSRETGICPDARACSSLFGVGSSVRSSAECPLPAMVPILHRPGRLEKAWRIPADQVSSIRLTAAASSTRPPRICAGAETT